MTRFQVLGERSSGTNFVSRLLGRHGQMQSSSELGWKHGFPGDGPISPQLGIVCMVRRADVWALSMHAKPWHASPALQRLDFGDFIRAPWDTVQDHPKYFRGLLEPFVANAPLPFDRDPETGAMFPNLFALRRAKLAGLLSYLERDCTVVLLAIETAQAAPEATLDALLFAFGQPPRETPFRPITKRLGSKFNASVADRPETPHRMGKAGLRFLRQELDLDLEARLGYQYD